MKELGDTLKAERLKQGLTLEQVSKQTQISLNILRTLEEGDFEQIGTPLLIRSFIRNYCAALQLDPEPLLEEHQADILAYDQQQTGIQSYRRWAMSGRKRRGKRLLVFLLLAVAVGAAGFVAVHVTKKKAQQEPGAQFVGRDINPQEEIPSDLSRSVASTPQEPKQITTAPIPKPVKPAAPAKQPAAVQPQPNPAASAAPAAPAAAPPAPPAPPAATPAASPEAAPAATPGPTTVPPGGTGTATVAQPAVSPQKQGHQLQVEAVQKVWIQVRIDGKKTNSALLQPGDKRAWEAQTTMQILVGNAGGVQMQWDGQPLRSLGRSGQVVRLTLPNPKYLQNKASPTGGTAPLPTQ